MTTKKAALIAGRNIQATVSGSTLTLTIDLSTELGPTGSGKNIMIASTGGNVPLPAVGGSLLLHLYRPPTADDAKAKRKARALRELDEDEPTAADSLADKLSSIDKDELVRMLLGQ